MWVLGLGLGHHLKGIQTTCMGYFEMTLHVGIAFRVDSSFKFAIFVFVKTSTNWNFWA
jgi:hypothetical protein